MNNFYVLLLMNFNHGNRRYHQVDTNPNYDSGLLTQLIKGSLGYGYHYVHLQRGTKN